MTIVRKSLDELSVSQKRLERIASRREEDIDYSDIAAKDTQGNAEIIRSLHYQSK